MLINGNEPSIGAATVDASTNHSGQPNGPQSPPTPTANTDPTLTANNGVQQHPLAIATNTLTHTNGMSSTTTSMVGSYDDSRTAQAVLVCRKNSHPFLERRVPLMANGSAPIKVGRAVARSKPTTDNFVFDCKVLSRNHASLWFENQKFWLQDTRSSNGTFINNQRLSPANEESVPREVYSGDIVQFGVDVMENQRKVTHGCIIATIRLFNPDGSEAKQPDNQSGGHPNGTPASGTQSNVYISSQQLYELSQYIQEAIHREQILENKLETLERVVSSAQESANTGWKSLVEEDRLLSRIETLQNKLEVCINSSANSQSSAATTAANNNKESTDSTDSTVSALLAVREEMVKLIDDKDRYESAAKEAIQRSLEEKLIVLNRLHEHEVTAHSNEEECARLQEVCATSAQEINRLANQNDELAKEIETYAGRLKGAEDQKIALIEATAKDREDLEATVTKLRQKEAENESTIKELQTLQDAANLQLERLRLQLEVIKQQQSVSLTSDANNSLVNDNNNVCNINNNSATQGVDGVSDDDHQSLDNSVVDNSNELQIIRKQLVLSNAKCIELSDELQDLRHQLNTESTVTLTQSTTTTTITAETDAAIDTKPVINGEIFSTNDETIVDNTTHVDSSSINSSTIIGDDVITGAEQLTTKVLSIVASVPVDANQQTTSQQLTHEIDLLKELLTETRAAKKSTDEELSRTVTELENLRSLTKQLSRESDDLQDKLDGMGREVDDRNSSIQTLKNQINELQERVRHSADEYQELKRQLGDNERVLTLKDAELQSLRVLLDEERKVQQKYANNYDQCRRQLADTQSAAKQSQTEAELLRKKVYSRNEELRTSRTNLSATGEPVATITAEEHERLVNECQTLRSRLETVDNELQVSSAERHKLVSDHQCLQQSYELLQRINTDLESRGDSYWREQYDTVATDVQTHQSKLLTVCKEFEDLKLKSEDYFKENQTLNEDLKGANEEIEVISYQNKIATACAVIPLIILLIAVIMAYYPSVSTVTGTTDL